MNIHSIRNIFYSCDKNLFSLNKQGYLMSTTSSKQVLISNLIPYEVSIIATIQNERGNFIITIIISFSLI